MATGRLNDGLLRLPEGGSLNELDFQPQSVVKRYNGVIPRGYEKLRREYWFLTELPDRIASRFARPLRFLDQREPPLIELSLERKPHPAAAKAILLRLLSPDRTAALISDAFRFLLDELYPLRTKATSYGDVYRQFHRGRLETAIKSMSPLPQIGELIWAKDIRINGLRCPSIAQTLNWLDGKKHSLFGATSQLVAAHGDAHLDNILVSTEGPLTYFFIDPRGELLLPPHYDFAKMLKACRTGYDPVHYGLYEIAIQATSHIDVSFAVDHSFDAHYSAGLAVLLDAFPAFAEAERLSERAFRTAVLIAELVHVISFSYYHANHPRGRNDGRVLAYLATACLLARELMSTNDHSADLTTPLPI